MYVYVCMDIYIRLLQKKTIQAACVEVPDLLVPKDVFAINAGTHLQQRISAPKLEMKVTITTQTVLRYGNASATYIHDSKVMEI